MDFITLLIVLAGGFLAGVVNTLAGNGSAITLTILTEVLGLPGTVANGTNRIGIAAQSVLSAYGFHRHGRLNVRDKWQYLLPIILGAIVGIYVATQVDNEQFRKVFRYLMVVMLFVILIKPKRWLRETDSENKPPLVLMVPLTFALGFYGGFIQMGMGVFFLALMVLVGRFSLLDSNAMKIFVIAIYTFIALFLFQMNGLVDWKTGSILAIAQAAGGFLTANYASQSPKANLWAHRLLIVVVLAAVVKLFVN